MDDFDIPGTYHHDELERDWDEPYEPEPDCDDGDDGYALASAGHGTDEDYYCPDVDSHYENQYDLGDDY
jgi:hypothetical protein